MAEKYEFDVQANTQRAEASINKLDNMLKDIQRAQYGQNVGATSTKGVDELLNEYNKLDKTFGELKVDADEFSGTHMFKGGEDAARNLNNLLDNTQNKLAQAANGINKLGATGKDLGASLKPYQDYLKGSEEDLSKNVALMRELKLETSRLKTLERKQFNIGRAAESGTLTQKQQNEFRANNSELERYGSGRISEIENLRHEYSKKYNASSEELAKKDENSDDKTLATILNRELSDVLDSLDDFEGSINKARSLNDDVNNSVKRSQPTIAPPVSRFDNVDVKSILQGALLSFGVRSVGNFISGGLQTNQSTGEQALQLGNVSGHQSSRDLQRGVQGIMMDNWLGYNTQDGLDFEQLASRRMGYSGGARGRAQTRSMTNALEVGGRSSGITSEQWKQTANSAMQSGGIFSTQDITRLSRAVAGENIRSGNKGDTQGNAQIITSAIQQISRSSGLGMNGIDNVAASASTLSRMSKQFQGDQGQQNINNLNSGFQSASSGQNPSLMYMKIQSDPAKYGGMNGYLKAQESLAKGLGDTSNIGFVSNYVQKMSASGSQGQAAGALMLESQFGLTPEAADKLSQEMADGKMSESQLAKEAKKLQASGKSQTSKNLDSYKHDSYGDLNQIQAEEERDQSEVAGATGVYQKGKKHALHSSPVVGVMGSVLGSIGGLASTFTGAGYIGHKLASSKLVSKAATTVKNSKFGIGVSGIINKAGSALGNMSEHLRGTGFGQSKFGGGVLNGVDKAANKLSRKAQNGVSKATEAAEDAEGVANGVEKGGGFFSGIKNLFSGSSKAEEAASGAEKVAEGASKVSKGAEAGGLLAKVGGSGVLKAGGKLLEKAAPVLWGVEIASDAASGITRAGQSKPGFWNRAKGFVSGAVNGFSGGLTDALGLTHDPTKNPDGSTKSTTEGVVNSTQSAKNKSDTFLTARQYEADLKKEQDNINRRENSLSTFSKLLKEEKNGTTTDNKAGTVKKSGSSSKNKSKSKVSTKSFSTFSSTRDYTRTLSDPALNTRAFTPQSQSAPVINITVNGAEKSDKELADTIAQRVSRAIATNSKNYQAGY